MSFEKTMSSEKTQGPLTIDIEDHNEAPKTELDFIRTRLRHRFSKSMHVDDLTVWACLEAGYTEEQIIWMKCLQTTRTHVTGMGSMLFAVNLHRFASGVMLPGDRLAGVACFIVVVMLGCDYLVGKDAEGECGGFGFHRIVFHVSMWANFVLFFVALGILASKS